MHIHRIIQNKYKDWTFGIFGIYYICFLICEISLRKTFKTPYLLNFFWQFYQLLNRISPLDFFCFCWNKLFLVNPRLVNKRLLHFFEKIFYNKVMLIVTKQSFWNNSYNKWLIKKVKQPFFGNVRQKTMVWKNNHKSIMEGTYCAKRK